MAPRRSSRQPREWAKEPKRFGEVPTDQMEWVTPADDFERVCLHAAQIQHEVVFVANFKRRARDLTWKDLASQFQMSYVQLVKVIRGEAHLSMRHVADLSREFGPLLITEYRRQAMRAQRD